jgi:SDR family mycofactocin-dependent oxidoreductase
MGRFEGKTVFVTGAARGQGRSHALAFAREGANIAAVDIAAQIDSVEIPMATPEDLAETVRLIEEQDRRCLSFQADVRDKAAIEDAVAKTVAEFGTIDILVNNHGIAMYATLVDTTDEAWHDMVDTTLTGTWNCLKAVVPHMLAQKSGRIIITGSGTVRWPQPNMVPYVAAKFGLIGIVKSLSQEVVREGITVNAVNPGLTKTDMILNDVNYRLFVPDVENPTREDAERVWAQLGANGEPYMQPEDITDGVLFLASPEAKKISGLMLDVAGGQNAYQMG